MFNPFRTTKWIQKPTKKEIENKKEETKENSPAFDSTRGEADHATSQELKRYAPEQSIFVDEEASRESRTHVDALVQKIRKHRS